MLKAVYHSGVDVMINTYMTTAEVSPSTSYVTERHVSARHYDLAANTFKCIRKQNKHDFGDTLK